MKKKVFSSLVLSGLMATSAYAVDVNFFGHIGGAYNQGLSGGNKSGVDNDKASYGGVTGHLGVDFGFNALHLGVGAYGSFPIYGTKIFNEGYYENQADVAYSKKYADLSDLYIKYDGGDLTIAVGRFNNEFLDSPWINAYMQGVAAKWKIRSFGAWATWMNDYTTYGYAFNRIASELMSYHRFPSSFNGFGIGNEVFAGGLNFDFKFLKFDPYVNYFFNKGSVDDSIQAGARLALVFGDNGPVQSTTSIDFMWENTFGISNDDTMLLLTDEELLFGGVFKLGGGFLATTGGNGIVAINNPTRFYGAKFLTPNYNYGSSGYFFAKNNTWYVFTGVKSQYFDLDVLYANGDYNEFSAIASFTVFDKQVKGSLNGIALKVGGGYVNNGFKSNAFQHSNVVGFAKLSF